MAVQFKIGATFTKLCGGALCWKASEKDAHCHQLSYLAALERLEEVLPSVEPAGMAACVDYVLFPLLFTVDSAALLRAPEPPGGAVPRAPAVPAASSDRVAERALRCLLARVAALADIGRERSAEEVRNGSVRCLEALLVAAGRAPDAGGLRDEANAPLLAFLTSLLLKTAEGEARAGHAGSKALRATALRSLRRLIAAVGDGDVLAFVLPGVASGLLRALLLAGASHGPRGRTGAAASSAAAAEAVRALAAIALPPLCAHPSAAVRAALARGAVELLQRCAQALAPHAEMLLELVLTLAQDGWPQVSCPARAFIAAGGAATALDGSQGLGSRPGRPGGAVGDLAARLVSGLAPALRSGESAGALHAQKLASALQAAPPATMADALIHDPGRLAALTYHALAGFARGVGRMAAAAGGTSLRALVDGLLRALQAAAPAPVPSSNPAPAAAPDWQLPAAAAVTATAEVLFGASPAWRPQGDGLEGLNPSEQGLTRPAAPELEALAGLVLAEWVRKELWGVPTSAEAAGDAPALPTLQELGQNALLARVLLEAVGAMARAAGPRFASSGRLLRPMLLPLLERLADPCPSVAASAAAAISSVCSHCGYAGLDGLVAGNADYVVDGLCRQLRHLDEHPRAPFLFAALLRRAGVAPALLPLLAEPARAAVRGLAITARRKRPAHTAAFLASLREICAGAGADAAAVAAGTKVAAMEVERQVAAAASAAHAARGGPASGGSAGGQSSIAKIARYFEGRRSQKEGRPGEGAGDKGAGAEAEAEDDQPQVEWGAAEWAAAGERRRHAHAAAVLAEAAYDVAGPLLMSPDLRVALLALEVGQLALVALRDTSAALDLHENRIAPLVRPKSSIEPVAPETPKLLPAVHVFWGTLAATLKDPRIAVVERALAVLAAVAELSGSFLARRLSAEAWPQMARLLREGPILARTPSMLPGEERHAPAVLQRARVAVLACLNTMASNEHAAPALRGIAADAAEAAAAFLGTAEPPAASQRDLFYRLKHLDIFGTPEHVNQAIQALVAILRDCRTIAEYEFVSDARYLVVVEKDAVFQRLVDDDFSTLADCILVTAKGMPDVATRAFVHTLLHAVPHLTPVALVDWNPSGAAILAVYKYGSQRMHEAARRVSAPFLEKATERSVVTDVDQILDNVAKDVTFAAGGTAEAELCDNGAAVFDGSCSIAESQLHGSMVRVVWRGELSNYEDICELYITPTELTVTHDCARLMLTLYLEASLGYPDEWRDTSDQPFTFLSALEGDFMFVLHDAGAGYTMAVRSATGRSPLFWGADEAGDYALFATSPAGRLSAFPQGCAFESQVDDAGGENRVVDFRRHTRSARPVRTVPRVDSKGHLCGLMCTSKSGRDLVEAASQPGDVY
ncbi:hypothetical protein WJX81_002818 [Elliptochloris bilobata]|uniref:Uncharacterized protein n=1 Tax=Elliptochloris bilobata TaxID=381761 RepID=A0AAW1QHR9_9CHLO